MNSMINIHIVIRTTLTKICSKKHHAAIIFFMFSIINWKYYENLHFIILYESFFLKRLVFI